MVVLDEIVILESSHLAWLSINGRVIQGGEKAENCSRSFL
jgi:hypothetical protein